MYYRQFRNVAAACCLVLMTGACASIVEGTDQTVTVSTDPPGASCELERKGELIGVINPTPGSITIGKSASDVAVLCAKDGYHNQATSLRSEFEAMTFGNAIFGGLIGVAIDASSGAMHEYPSMVTVALRPNAFSSEAERDAYFDRRQTGIEETAARAIQTVEKECTPDKQQECKRAIEKIEANRDAELAELQAQRRGSRINPALAEGSEPEAGATTGMAGSPAAAADETASTEARLDSTPEIEDPWEGRWMGEGKGWEIEMKIDRGQVSGWAKNPKCGRCAVYGTIDRHGTVVASIPSTSTAWGRLQLRGRMPSLTIGGRTSPSRDEIEFTRAAY